MVEGCRNTCRIRYELPEYITQAKTRAKFSDVRECLLAANLFNSVCADSQVFRFDNVAKVIHEISEELAFIQL